MASPITVTLTDDSKVGYDDGSWHGGAGNFYISNGASVGAATTNGITFALNDTIVAGSTITSCYIRVYLGGAASGVGKRNVALEAANPNSNTAWGSGHRPVGATYGTASGESGVATATGYEYGVSDSVPQNLAALVQAAVDAYGTLNSGALLNFAWNNTYTAYNQLHDPGSTEPPVLTIAWTVAVDSTAPTYGASPSVNLINGRSVTFKATASDETSATVDHYMVVVADGATAPSTTQIIAGHDSTDSNALASTSSTGVANGVQANMGIIAPLELTAYDAYFTVKDAAGNAATRVKVDFTTGQVYPQLATPPMRIIRKSGRFM